MESRRLYVITTSGELGPYTQEELRAALDQGVIALPYLVRTSMGTVLGTVASQLPSASRPRERSGMDSGQRRARQFNKFSLLVVAITLLLAAAMAVSLRPGAALTVSPSAVQAADASRPAARSPGQALPGAMGGASAPSVLPSAAPPPLPPPAACVAASSRSLHRDLMVWDGAELGGGWRAPGPPTLVPARAANERRHGHAVVHCHGEGSNFANFGWNWIGWFPSDGGTDVSAMRSLIFAIRIVGDPVCDSVRVALNTSAGKASSNEVDIVRLVPAVRDGAWHEVEVPLASLLDASPFNARKAWELKLLTWSKGTRTVDIYLDEIGFAR